MNLSLSERVAKPGSQCHICSSTEGTLLMCPVCEKPFCGQHLKIFGEYVICTDCHGDILSVSCNICVGIYEITEPTSECARCKRKICERHTSTENPIFCVNCAALGHRATPAEKAQERRYATRFSATGLILVIIAAVAAFVAIDLVFYGGNLIRQILPFIP